LVATGCRGSGPRPAGVESVAIGAATVKAAVGSLQARAILFVEDQAVKDRKHLLAIGTDTP
jgi:hypothetical protein